MTIYFRSHIEPWNSKPCDQSGCRRASIVLYQAGNTTQRACQLHDLEVRQDARKHGIEILTVAPKGTR